MNNQSYSSVVRSQHRGGGSGGGHGHGRHQASSRGRASHRRDEHNMRHETRSGQHDRSSPRHLVPYHRGQSTSSIYRHNSASAPASREHYQSHHPGSSRSRKQDTYQRRLQTNNKYDRSTDSLISEECALRDASNVMGTHRVPADEFNRNKNAESYAINITRQSNPTQFSNTHTIPELIQIAYDNLTSLKPSTTAAFWNKVLKQMSARNANLRLPSHQEQELGSRLNQILKHTVQTVSQFGPMHLSQAIYSLAKLVDVLRKSQRERGKREVDISDMLSDLLMNMDMSLKKELFRSFAIVSVRKLRNFDARHLSNIAYAYALIRYVPEVNDGSCLFDHLAIEAQSAQRRNEFKSQELSNIVWAYATVNKSYPVLFEAMGNQIVAFKQLEDFKPQALSNTVWAYAKSNIPHPALFEEVANHMVNSDSLDRFNSQGLANILWAYATAAVPHRNLFEKVAHHIVESDSLDRFKPQNLSNTLWAYAKIEISHPKLFEKVADHITGLDNLNRFNSQELANTVWAYANAEVPHPKLLEKVATHITRLYSLDRFDPQALSNIVWAYATTNIPHPTLFKKMAFHIVQSDILDRFNSQDVSNTVWAYATMGMVDKELFSSVIPRAAKSIDTFNDQELANLAWAYAVANVEAPTLFNDNFIKNCFDKEDRLKNEELVQLHLWHLWQAKEKSHDGLPQELVDRCYTAYISIDPRLSKLHEDVVAQLSSIGLDPKEEVLMKSGYRVDAIVEVNGKTIGVEVDGPYHFIGRSKSPTGSTILKRRQVPSIDGIELVSVPYWEWDKFGMNQVKKQEYLRKLLRLRVTE